MGVWLHPPIQLRLPMTAPPFPILLAVGCSCCHQGSLLVSVKPGDAPSLAAAGVWQWGRRLAASFVGHSRELVPDAAQPV